jgi:hypothetical protein
MSLGSLSLSKDKDQLGRGWLTPASAAQNSAYVNSLRPGYVFDVFHSTAEEDKTSVCLLASPSLEMSVFVSRHTQAIERLRDQ